MQIVRNASMGSSSATQCRWLQCLGFPEKGAWWFGVVVQKFVVKKTSMFKEGVQPLGFKGEVRSVGADVW